MEATRKITVQAPEALLESAQAFAGEGVTGAVVEGLKRLANIRAQQELRKLRGKVKFSRTAEELRYDRE